jgi:hypothetical protein
VKVPSSWGVILTFLRFMKEDLKICMIVGGLLAALGLIFASQKDPEGLKLSFDPSIPIHARAILNPSPSDLSDEQVMQTWSIAIAKHAGEPFEDESEKWALREIGGCISGMNGDDSGL